ncbi:MAG: ABC transporter ATP-binding protein [Chloroflexota bacterium]
MIGRFKLEARNIDQHYRGADDWLSVLRDVNVQVREGEFVSVIGPSGCGKSTFFNVLAGLRRPTHGAVLLDGVDVTGAVGSLGYMQQKDLLLPWKTVLDNVILGARLAGVSKAEAQREARSWFPRFGLEGFEQAYPDALSGGMKQRSALLRTVLAGRDVLLLDEPFGALDALTRVDMQSWLLDICEGLSKTILLITHDVDEAIYLSDRMYVMSARPGAIVDAIDTSLSGSRDHDATVTSHDFIALKKRALHTLRGPSMAGALP